MPALAPFRLDLTVWALHRRPDTAVDTRLAGLAPEMLAGATAGGRSTTRTFSW
jgi:hypothetical protein